MPPVPELFKVTAPVSGVPTPMPLSVIPPLPVILIAPTAVAVLPIAPKTEAVPAPAAIVNCCPAELPLIVLSKEIEPLLDDVKVALAPRVTAWLKS